MFSTPEVFFLEELEEFTEREMLGGGTYTEPPDEVEKFGVCVLYDGGGEYTGPAMVDVFGAFPTREPAAF